MNDERIHAKGILSGKCELKSAIFAVLRTAHTDMDGNEVIRAGTDIYPGGAAKLTEMKWSFGMT
ncbi:MAG TPA: hypothetical protein ENK25_02375 [Bacteroidetes bacterium]|nr:hypothetical protein [Bacteroidota bacterium]